MTDETYMKLAIDLARKGTGHVNPNPLVGAVIVKDNEIIGQGWHMNYGGLHAERNALKNCTSDPKDATMYVTLEPCCHYGKTPPCTEAIIAAGIRRVIIGCGDTNKCVAGKGIHQLQSAGIDVVTGVLETECIHLNEIFFHYMKHLRPYVTMKYAMTMDGKIATVSGESRWITGEMARTHVHEARNQHMAIMVGIGTVLSDDPMLNCRIANGCDPIRIICDTHLQTPLQSRLVQTAADIRTIIATSVEESKLQKPYCEKGCEVLTIPKNPEHIDLNILMDVLGNKGIDSILLEGGSTLNEASLKAQIVQKIQAYIAPKIFGGNDAKTPVGGIGFPQISQSVTLDQSVITTLGPDLLIESEVSYPCSQVL